MQAKVLRVIYTFFVGILIGLFVGVGIAAFYPEPTYPDMPAELKVMQIPAEPQADPTTQEVQKSSKLVQKQAEYDKLTRAYEQKMKIYNRNVSIIALIASIIILVISLTTFNNLEVLADGLLLGGVISLLYSVARVFGSGDDKVRFVVVSAGLAVALILGYVKFVTPSQKTPSQKPTSRRNALN